MSDHDDALFEVIEGWLQKAVGRSAGRTQRHRFLISIGFHPLSLKLRQGLRLHPQAWRTSARTRWPTPAPTCGTCVHLERLDLVPEDQASRSPWKCWFAQGSRVSRGEATTVRKWWPACVDYKPGDSRDDNFTATEAGP